MCGFATCRGTPGIRLPPTEHSFLPVWTHDGKRVTFSSSRGGVPNLFSIRADGSGVAELLTPSEYPQYPQSWSADGKLLFRQRSSPTTGSGGWDCNVLSPEGERKPRPFLTHGRK